MTCQELWEAASDYLDGAADEGTTARIQDHAAGCEVCRAELEAVARALAAPQESVQPAPDRHTLAQAARLLRAVLEIDPDSGSVESQLLMPPSRTPA